MHEISKLLPSAFLKQVRRDDPRWLEILIALWPSIVGNTMAQHSKPAVLQSGVLTLRTGCATWAAQLRQMTEEIRARTNSFVGQAVIRKLRISLAPQLDLFSFRDDRQAPSQHVPVAAKSPVDTTSIPDQEIARVVATSWAKYFSREWR